MNKMQFNELTQELLKQKMDLLNQDQIKLNEALDPIFKQKELIHKQEEKLNHQLKQLQYEKQPPRIKWKELINTSKPYVNPNAETKLFYHMHASKVLYWVHVINKQLVLGLNLLEYNNDKQLIINTINKILPHINTCKRTYNKIQCKVQYIRCIMPDTNPGQDYLAFHSNKWFLFRQGCLEITQHSTDTLEEMIDYLIPILNNAKLERSTLMQERAARNTPYIRKPAYQYPNA